MDQYERTMNVSSVHLQLSMLLKNVQTLPIVTPFSSNVLENYFHIMYKLLTAY